MLVNPVTAMDVDSPSGTLKRCSSAPMINENSTGMTTAPSTSSSSREQSTFNLGPSTSQRTRRSSYSFSPAAGSPKLAPRINQIRQEECADFTNLREVAHEREIHHTMQMSQSWDDLRLVTDSNEQKGSKFLPLQITLPNNNFNNCNSPSPTRTMPGFQSPTRTSKTFIRRSASPVLRPSPLGVKRKLDEEKSDFYLSPRIKRFQSMSIDRGGLLTTSSPLQGSLSSVGTPESLSSADSPSFSHRMIDSPSPNCAPAPEPMIVTKPDQEMSEEPS